MRRRWMDLRLKRAIGPEAVICLRVDLQGSDPQLPRWKIAASPEWRTTANVAFVGPGICMQLSL
jgi:hypothetical protein